MSLHYEVLCKGKWPFRLTKPYWFQADPHPKGWDIEFYDGLFRVGFMFADGRVCLSEGYAIDGATVCWPISRVLNQPDAMHIWFRHDFGCQFDQLPAMQKWMPRHRWDEMMREDMSFAERRAVRMLATPAYLAVRGRAMMPKRRQPTLHAIAFKP